MSAGFNTNTRSREDLSLRLKTHNVRKARDESQRLETESRKMEERLQELRLAMNREKEDRERQGGGFWSRGQTGNLNNYATDVLKKPSSSKSGSGKKKVKVLKDTPLDVPERPSQPGTMAHIAKQNASSTPRQKVKGPKCGQCEEKRAAVSCVQCSELYCPGCFASFHLRGALKKHRSIPISATGPRQCMSPRPIPSASSSREFDPSQPPAEAASTMPKSYFNGVRDHNRNSPEGASGSFDGAPSIHNTPQFNGPSLLDGDYNEADSAASFQSALQAWRTGNEEQTSHTATPQSVQSVHTPRVLHVETPRVDHGTETQKPPPVEIKFSSNLSYAERLLLKKHRRTDIDEMETPRVSLPPTPRLPNPYTPRDVKEEVEMPVIRSEALTPRIESYPRQKASLPNEEEDFDDEERVNFQALYNTVKALDPDARPVRRDEDNISIIELTESNQIRSSRMIEETSNCLVQESTDLEAWTVDRQGGSKSQETSGRPSSVNESSRSNSTTFHSNQNEENKENFNQSTRHMSSTKDIPPKSSSSKSRLGSSIKSRPASSVKSRPSSAVNRPKSRVMSSRPGSRSNSRAGSRMEGEGLLTKTPSEGLRVVAQMSADYPEQRSVPLEELFMIGVVPEPRERTMTPSRHKASKEEKFKVSNKLYQMAPRSWRPDSSLANNVDEDHIQIEPVEDPLNQAVADSPEPVDVPSATLLQYDSFLQDNMSAGTPTPRNPSQASYTRDNALPSSARSRKGDVTLPTSARSRKANDALPSSARSRRNLPTTPKHDPQRQGLSPQPPSQPKSPSPRQSSKMSRPSSNMSRPSSNQSLSRTGYVASHAEGRSRQSARGTPRSSSSFNEVDSSQSTNMEITPRNSSSLSDINRPRSTARDATQRSNSSLYKDDFPQSNFESINSRTNSRLRDDEFRYSREERPSSSTSSITPRIHSSLDNERPVSRAIVMDGEDLSSYDNVGEQENRNQDDDDALDKLEWELASQSGRITADGKISRLSELPDSDGGSTSSSRSFSRMSQQDQGYDINSRLREDELGSDEEEEEDQDAEDVKALH